MRIWDVSPAYLNRESLLGEHRELHGLHSILVHGQKGYSRHPETLRWVGCVSGLSRRHAHLVAEMTLRGYTDRTPIRRAPAPVRWPGTFVTMPSLQYSLLGRKYATRLPGRVGLPRSAHELWAHHKYSVMARDQSAYREIGRRVSRMRRGAALDALAEDLVVILRTTPSTGSLTNALEHMWGHVSKSADARDRDAATRSTAALMTAVRRLAMRTHEPYLMASTALSELTCS